MEGVEHDVGRNQAGMFRLPVSCGFGSAHLIEHAQHFVILPTLIHFPLKPGGFFGNQQELVLVQKLFLSRGELDPQQFHDSRQVGRLVHRGGRVFQSRA